jgi:hypothetical protein
VEVVLKYGKHRWRTESDDAGVFSLTDLPAGECTLVFTSGEVIATYRLILEEGGTLTLTNVAIHEAQILGVPTVERVTETPTVTPPVVVNVVTNLDQSQLTTGGGGAHMISVIARALQVFTPGVSGNLVKVDVELAPNMFGGLGDMTVAITTVPGGDPNNGVILGEATIPAAAIGGGFETATFSPGIALTDGVLYAIRISPAVGGECDWLWNNGANPYAGGQIWSDPGTGTFSALSGDAKFQTYMEVPAP